MVVIEKASPKDADEIVALINKVHETMEHQEWFVINSAEDYQKCLDGEHGVGFKAVDTETGRIAGVFTAVIPEDKETNLGYDVGFGREDADLCAIMDTAAILPEYRGQNLQYRTMMATEEYLKQKGYRYLLCTVHPENRFSLHNVLKQGYEIKDTKEKYGGYLRHVLLKELE